ncbi:outer membrane protein assembly factor BamC [Escherichia coli]
MTSGDYAIPVTNGSGAVGKALDIRPPAQPLALVSGRAYPVHGRYRFIAGGKWSWQYSVAAGG